MSEWNNKIGTTFAFQVQAHWKLIFSIETYSAAAFYADLK
jgi:hypothetical protein